MVEDGIPAAANRSQDTDSILKKRGRKLMVQDLEWVP